MAQAGKINNAIQEMERMEIKVLGVSEMRWPGSGSCDINEHRVYYSGTSNGQYQSGVGIIVSKTIAECVTNIVPISERVMLLQINALPAQLNIIQVYAPTTDHSDEEVAEFYSQITDVLQQLSKKDLTILMGDFNAKIGRGSEGDIIGHYGLGQRNERGEQLSAFAGEWRFVITNTFFNLPARRLYTWKSPRDSNENIIRNQIDYILINQRYRNSCVSMKTYPGADINSDHTPLVGVFKIRMKHIKKKSVIQYNVRKLKESSVRRKAEVQLNNELTSLADDLCTEKKIENLTTTVLSIKEEHLKADATKKKSWMTEEILEMMDSRRKVKNNPDEYRNINKEIRKQIRTAKEREIQEKCNEIENLQLKYDSFNVHRKVKEVTGKYRTGTRNRLVNNEGKIIVGQGEIKDTWKTYIEQLFYDNRPEPPQIKGETGPNILIEEVQAAINGIKDGKAPGPDNVNAEILKLLSEDNVKWLTKIFNDIYDSGNIPREWLKSEFITLPKKNGAKTCSEYRTISLMSHMLKIFLKVIHRRIYKICEEQISSTQFGFRNGLGTREALFSIQVLFQRCRDMNCDIYACFIDYQKAFDRVKHQRIAEILENIGLDDKDLRIIVNLYWNQSASVRLGRENTEDVDILRGVRQGCILSPLIFNVYSEYIFKEALDDVEMGVLLNGNWINNIRYADDTVIFADSQDSLQYLMDRITHTSHEYGLHVNPQKTKTMVISKNKAPVCHLKIGQDLVEQVHTYIYLGTTVNDQWDSSDEVRSRIGKARAVFNKMGNLFKNHGLTMATKIRLLHCYVYSTLFYGAETWTLTEELSKRLEAFEMWLYRRILKVPWTDHVTNVDILKKMKKEKEVLTIVKTRKIQYLGHIMRNGNRYHLLQSILQGKIPGKRSVGRRRISWLKNIRTWTSKTSMELFQAARDRSSTAKMVANIRNG